MTELEHSYENNGRKPRFRNTIGLFGLILGIAGFIASVAGPYIADSFKPPQPPPPKLSDVVAEAGNKFVGKMLEHLKGVEAEAAPKPPPPIPWDKYFAVAGVSLGILGAVCGTTGWIRREDNRLSASAIAASMLAVAWTYVVAALVIAFVILLLWLVVSIFHP